MQNSTTSLANDVAATRQVIAAQEGPVLLVGHSYGGVVITEAGNDPKVIGLVYIAAFAPDRGESVSSLIKDPAPGAPVPPIIRGRQLRAAAADAARRPASARKAVRKRSRFGGRAPRTPLWVGRTFR